MSPKRIIVTGANKGVGEGIVRRILSNYSDVFVFLGSRNRENGETTKKNVLREIPNAEGRLEVLMIDVSKDESVSKAAQVLRARFGEKSIYGLVNNAAISDGSGEEVINVNYRGIKRMVASFLGLMEENGRIVNVSSAAGPVFVNGVVDVAIKRLLTSKAVSEDELDELADLAALKNEEDMSRFGGGSVKHYHISKAIVNAYTMYLARMHTNLLINACTPGFIATDMVRRSLQRSGRSIDEAGCKSILEGAIAPCKLLFEIERTGKYFGSDGLRSPLDRYRSPGDAPYISDDEI